MQTLTPHASAHTPLRGLNTTAMAALLALVALATLVRGGNRHVAMLGLEWLALAGLLAMAWGWLIGSTGTSSRNHRADAPVGTTPATAWAWGLLLTAPLWLAAWTWLPMWMGARPALTTPDANWSTALLGLPLLCFLVAGRWATNTQAETLAKAWLWVAVVQALWGLLQVAGLDGLRFDAVSKEPAIGSFASKNTYSNLLVMAMPLAVWGMAAARQAAAKRSKQANKWSGQQLGAWGWLLALLVLLCTVLLGTSRTGIATGVLVVVLALPLLLGQRSATRHRHAGTGGFRRRWLLAGVAGLLGLALLAAGWEWAARFEADRLLADDATRALMRQTTWQAALAHWPWGSGPGSYEALYPPWQPVELGHLVINMAHNDYLQKLMELGLAWVLLLAAALWLVLHQLWHWWHGPAPQGRSSASMRQLQVAAGLGVLAITLHAWVDYPFHIPANAMMGCFLLGVFLRPTGVQEQGAPVK